MNKFAVSSALVCVSMYPGPPGMIACAWVWTRTARYDRMYMSMHPGPPGMIACTLACILDHQVWSRVHEHALWTTWYGRMYMSMHLCQVWSHVQKHAPWTARYDCMYMSMHPGPPGMIACTWACTLDHQIWSHVPWTATLSMYLCQVWWHVHEHAPWTTR